MQRRRKLTDAATIILACLLILAVVALMLKDTPQYAVTAEQQNAIDADLSQIVQATAKLSQDLEKIKK